MALLRLAVLSVALSVAVRGAEIRFVPPTAEGAVSLGIFDASDRLVRLLCDERPIGEFDAGLNGLSVGWDGKDAAGRPVPTGTYRARGFVIGNVGVEGEAFHFNDWITSADAPRIVSIGAVAVFPGGDLLLAARLAGDNGAILRYSPRSPDPWQTLAAEKIPDVMGKTALAIASDRAFILTDKKIRALDLSTGKEVSVPALASEPLDISARDGRLLVLGDGKLRIFGAADFARRLELSLPEVDAASAALLEGDSVVVAGEDGSLWHGGQSWKKIEVPDETKAKALAAGRAATFWVLEQKEGRPAAIVQYSSEEGRLAEWVSPSDISGAALAASTGEDYFCAVFRGFPLERTVAIRRGEGGSWRFVADKTITACSDFGLVDGQLSPSSQDIPSRIDLELAQNPLDPSAPRSLTVRAAEFSGGTGLVTADGLPLVRVSAEPGFARLMVLPGTGPGTVQFYQGDGACVEQYKLTNLDSIAAFDAGTIEMEDGEEKSAPPEEDRPDPTP